MAERATIDLSSRDWGPWVGGRIVATSDSRAIVEPYRGEVVATVGLATEALAGEAVEVARAAAAEAAALPVYERAAILRRSAEVAEGRVEQLAATITRETGKVIKDTRREAGRLPWTLRAAATAAETMGGELYQPDAMPGGEGITAFALRQPVGVVAAITPFNAPLNLVAHKMGPAVAAGNTMVLKPASAAPLPALLLAEILHAGRLPPGFVNVLPGPPPVGQAIVQHPAVRLITFTGGRAAGEAVLQAAGVRRVLLELGGNSPNIVHQDADLDVAVRQCLRGGFANNGQSCNSVQRIFVHRVVLDDFSKLLVDAVDQLRVGDPMDPETDVGPLVSEDSARRVAEWIEEAGAGGADVLTGGTREGAVIRPSVVANPPEDCRLWVDEVFAPVVLLFPYDDLDDAIRRSNDTTFGLQSAIFTRSLDVALRAGRELEAGAVLVNRSSNSRLDHLPYGGIKESGLGREGPHAAIREMTELKLVVIAPG